MPHNKEWYRLHRDDEIARNAKYYRDHKEAQAKRHRNTRHHITQEWFDGKLVEQNNCCAICFKPFEKTPHIDHSHACCKTLRSCDQCRRGLLCDDCNLGLGRFKDNVVVLQNAISYLQKYEKKDQ